MAYAPKYRIAFTNDVYEVIEIIIAKKDGEEGDIIEYAAESVTLSYNGSEGKYTPIIGLSLDIVVNLLATDPDFWPDFEGAQKDEWLVTATSDTQYIFHGFVVPDEGKVPFQDRPYSATITAVDGLGLIRETDLRQADGTEHRGEYSVMWYIACALLQTGLALPIRVFDNVYHKNMLTRADDLKWDLFSQTKLEYRTFLKDATTFVKGYEALEIILQGNCRLFYRMGEWCIVRISTIQYVPFLRYGTLYDYNGANGVGFEVLDNYATVGKNELTYPHGEDQYITAKPAAKSAKVIFNYQVWPELPRNNKFERGEAFNTGVAYDELDLDGDENTAEIIGSFTDYTIPDWDGGMLNIDTGTSYNLNPINFPLTPTSTPPFSRRVVNPYGVELIREVILPPAPGAQKMILRAEGIPVREGGRIAFGFDFRTQNSTFGNNGGFAVAALVYIIPENDSQGYSLVGNSGTDSDGRWTKEINIFIGRGIIATRYVGGDDDPRKYHSITVDSQPIPINGTLYINLVSASSPFGNVYFRNIDFRYTPFVAGGLREVKGEYHQISQIKELSAVVEQEVKLSPCRHKIIKGCMLDMNGIPLTDEFFRYDIAESRPYNQITAIQRFNNEYRRFDFIEGSFTGLKMAPNNNQENFQPHGLHWPYRFVDIPGKDKRFMINAPLEMDLFKGWMTARFHEVFSDQQVTDVRTETIPEFVDRIRAAIDNTPAGEWSSGAPAPGTPGYPPFTQQFMDRNRNRFQIYVPAGTVVTYGVGNADPMNTMQWTYQETDPYINYKLIVIEFTKIVPGGSFTFIAFGHEVRVEVFTGPVTMNPDGQLTGDKTEFKYIF